MNKLLILAGMPGSGKTYVLNKAVQQDIKLFGKKHHQDFVNFMKMGLSQGDPTNEDHMNRMDFTSPSFYKNTPYDGAFVYHVDLLGFYLKWIFDKPGKIQPVRDSDIEMLSDKSRRQERVSEMFNDEFDAGSRLVCVNNLDNGFEVNRAQFMKRKLKRRQTRLRYIWPIWRHIYRPTPFLSEDIDLAREIYDLITTAWREDIAFMGFDTVYRTKFVDDEYHVKRVKTDR